MLFLAPIDSLGLQGTLTMKTMQRLISLNSDEPIFKLIELLEDICLLKHGLNFFFQAFYQICSMVKHLLPLPSSGHHTVGILFKQTI